MNRLINTAIGGAPVGTLFDDDRRFDIVARFDQRLLQSVDAIKRLPVFSESEVPVPLAQVADIELVDGQTMIARDGRQRRITIRCDIEGRDHVSFGAEARARFENAVELPPGFDANWRGAHERLQQIFMCFTAAVPLALLVIYAMVLLAYGRHAYAAIVISAVITANVVCLSLIYTLGITPNTASCAGIAIVSAYSTIQAIWIIDAIASMAAETMTLSAKVYVATLTVMTPSLACAIALSLGTLPTLLATGPGLGLETPLAFVVATSSVLSTGLVGLVVLAGMRTLKCGGH